MYKLKNKAKLALTMGLLLPLLTIHCSKTKSVADQETWVSNDATIKSEQSSEVASPRLQVGQKAPVGLLVSSDGTQLDIKSTWDDQTAVIVFYRGHW